MCVYIPVCVYVYVCIEMMASVIPSFQSVFGYHLYGSLFLVYSHSITTATELAQVLPRRKAFRGDLQPASERLPSIG